MIHYLDRKVKRQSRRKTADSLGRFAVPRGLPLLNRLDLPATLAPHTQPKIHGGSHRRASDLLGHAATAH